MAAVLQLEKLAWTLPGGGEEIIRGVDLEVEEGRLVVITGPNGGGKTTLAKLIAGLETPAAGRILLRGKDITGLDITARARAGIAFAFQQPVRFKGLTVRDMLELAAGRTLETDALCSLLGRVGLCADGYVDRELNAGLSGGEMKRIEIATVLTREAQLAIFDEPEAGIDLWSFARLTETFEQIHQEGHATMIIISHQERIIRLADEIMVIANGQIAHRGSTEEVFPLILADTLGGCPVLERKEGAQ